MKPEILQRLLAAGSGRSALALVTRLSDGRQALVDRQVLCGDLSLGADQLAAVAHSVRVATPRSSIGTACNAEPALVLAREFAASSTSSGWIRSKTEVPRMAAGS